jgi:CHAT domain-containing protein
MTINNRNIALNSKNDTLTSMLREWMAVRDRISKVYSASLSDQNTAGLDSLLDMANALEVRLSKASNYFRQRISSSKSKVDFDVLKNSLKKEEAIADFFCFRYFNGRTYTNEVRYYAVLIFPGAEQPQWVKLGDEEQLKKIIDRNVSPQINNYTSSTRVSYQLYRQVWAPLEAFLGNVEKIHLSPAGLLNKISFAALMPDSSYLIDKYELAYHGNLRTFMQKIETDTNLIVHSNDALLMGDPEFNTALALLHPRRNGKNEKEEESESLKTSFPVNLMNTGAKNDLSGYFTDLHGTRTEVIQIQKLLDSLKLKTTIYLGAEVLEEKMQQISENPKPKVMHIATHGYFYPLAVVTDSTVLQKQTFKERMRYAINPLWRSGLVFSGANNTWKGILPPSDVEDGVMMAYEVANLDLFGVDLAVLSACDTGRGDLHNNEGVLGLQRAFKTAGVKHLLISLWRVPDVETSELMYAFYQNYLSGIPAREAFRLAQQKMIKKGYSAFYWAGFVLIE